MKTYSSTPCSAIRAAALGIALTTLLAVPTKGETMTEQTSNPPAIATFGGGCFWCVEAVFEEVPGVKSVTSGYMGGHVANPTYRQVSRGDTGHAEVARIEFDPAVVTYDELLDVFWKAHDPTQLNRQGADVGTQYRSVIFYHNEEQKRLAEASRNRLEASGEYKRSIVTQIVAADELYVAEDGHQDYYRNNPDAGYSRAVIEPKLRKLGMEK